MSVVVSEQLSDAAVGALCVLGRGIERVKTRYASVWRPTRYLEQPSAGGGHSGTRHQAALHDATSLIAGGNANLLAACTLLDRLRRQGHTPNLVIFAAGRPPYLSTGADPTLNEGIVMQDSFLRRASLNPRRTRLIILTENRNTYDDITSTISLAVQRGISQIAVITVRVHIARSMEFARQTPDIKNHLRLSFLAAEDLLHERYRNHPCIVGALDAARTSAAYQRTAAREAHGLQALRTGTYWTNR